MNKEIETLLCLRQFTLEMDRFTKEILSSLLAAISVVNDIKPEDSLDTKERNFKSVLKKLKGRIPAYQYDILERTEVLLCHDIPLKFIMPIAENFDNPKP